MIKQRVVIIGGGITGLTAAFYLKKLKEKKNLPIEIVILEASYRLGGKIQTIEKEGLLIEKGPASFIGKNKTVLKLMEELGLEDQIIYAENDEPFVLVRNKLYPIPKGSVLGIPTELGPFLRSSLLSPIGKIRASLDYILPKSKDKSDQSVGVFFRKRLGNEVVEHVMEPLISNMYAGDVDTLSLQSTFPHLFSLEQRYRSLIFGLKEERARKKAQKMSVDKSDKAYTLKSGLETMIQRLEEELSSERIYKGIKVEQIRKTDSQFEIVMNDVERLVADKIIFACPHQNLIKIFPNYSFFKPLATMPSTSVATISLAFSKNEWKVNKKGTDFVVAKNSAFTITSCTITNKKWPHTTRDGQILLRCFIGRPDEEEVIDLSDNDIVRIVLEDLNQMFNWEGQPDFSVVTRWKNALPQYAVGHQELLNKIKKEINEHLSGLFLTGSSYGGISLADCISQGEKAAYEAVQQIE